MAKWISSLFAGTALNGNRRGTGGFSLPSCPDRNQRNIKIMKRNILIAMAGAVLSFVVISSEAATLSLSPSSAATNVNHFYHEFSGGRDDVSLTFGTPTIQLRDYDTIQVTYNTPSGTAWRLNTDPGFMSSSLHFWLYYNTSFGAPYASITNVSWQFHMVEGTASSIGTNSLWNGSSLPNAGDRFYLSLGVPVNEDCAFDSCTLTVGFDNSGMSAASLAPFEGSNIEYDYSMMDFMAPDPGAQMTLESVPEPSAAALLGAAVICWAALRRNRRG
jgi:hypothetical protein